MCYKTFSTVPSKDPESIKKKKFKIAMLFYVFMFPVISLRMKLYSLVSDLTL